MRYVLPLGVMVGSAVLLGACASVQVTPALAPREAVVQAMAKLYEQPSFRLHAVMHMTLPPAPETAAAEAPGAAVAGNWAAVARESVTTADGETVASTSSASNAPVVTAPMPASQAMPPAVRAAMGVIFKRSDVTVDAVVDLRHAQVELVPGFEYQSKNAGAFVRVPMLFDLAAGQGYADLSAFSPWLVDGKNDGKYTAFSLHRLTDRVDVKKLLAWMRDTGLDNLRRLDAQDFADVPLLPGDAALGGVRRVRERVTFTEQADARKLAVQAHREQLLAAVRSAPGSVDGGVTPPVGAEGKAPDFVDIWISLLTMEGAAARAPMMTGTLEVSYLLDAAGRIVQGSYHVDGTPAGKALALTQMFGPKIVLDMETRFSDYGSARVSFVPSAENTVAWAENTKGTLLAGERAKPAGSGRTLREPMPPLPPKPSPLQGRWQLALSGMCTKNYYVNNNFAAFTTSGRDMSYVSLLLASKPNDAGYYKLTERPINDNGEKDCNDQLTTKGVTTRFVRFEPGNTAAQVCMDEAGGHCMALTRLPEGD